MAGPIRPPGRSRRRWWWVAALLVLVILGYGAVRILGQEHSTLPRAAKPLADDVLIWRRQRDGVFHLASINSDGSDERLLTSDPADNAAVISRDRRTVLFLRGSVSSPDPIGLWAVASDGSQERKLFEDKTPACPRLHRPAWRPDGLLAVVCDGPPGQPARLDILTLTGELVRTLDSGLMGDPTFTVDGSSVIYWRNPTTIGDGGALFRVAADGSSGPVQLTDGGAGTDADPACSPVSTDVAYRHVEDKRERIDVISSTGGLQSTPRELPARRLDAQDPSWSPDGSQISFREGPNHNSDLWVMDASGGSAKQVVANPEQDGVAVWSAR